MSRQAIAAVLARTDLASGERLVALSLASFAGRENRAWPGAPAASARAGLSRSRYQQAREQLVARGLVAVDERAAGRGRASTVTLLFADTGPWWDGEINVQLFETVLNCSAARGPERLLLAAMSAVSDDLGEVRGLSTEQLCTAAGIADRTYRRARCALLVSGRLELVSAAGGRGNTNVWRVRDPRQIDDTPHAGVHRRVAPPGGARPLVASVGSLGAATPVAREKGGEDRTVSSGECPVLTGVSDGKGGQDQTVSLRKCPGLTGVSGLKGGQGQTLFAPAPLETPAQTPAETPAANARAGTEPQNPGTRNDPPNPPGGGNHSGPILIEEPYVTARGRKRRRAVRIELDKVRRGLGVPGLADRNDWAQIRKRLREVVGDSMFEIWLDALELIALDPGGALVVDAPQATFSWLRHRYGRVIAGCAEEAARVIRFAEEAERQAFARTDAAAAPAANRAVHINQREVS